MNNDDRLKAALAKLLPDTVVHYTDGNIWWHHSQRIGTVRDTELLHLCALAEDAILPDSPLWYKYCDTLSEVCDTMHWRELLHAKWQQRVTALATVKGIQL